MALPSKQALPSTIGSFIYMYEYRHVIFVDCMSNLFGSTNEALLDDVLGLWSARGARQIKQSKGLLGCGQLGGQRVRHRQLRVSTAATAVAATAECPARMTAVRDPTERAVGRLVRVAQYGAERSV